MGEFVTAAQSRAHEAQGWPSTAYGATKVLFTSLIILTMLILSSNYYKERKKSK